MKKTRWSWIYLMLSVSQMAWGQSERYSLRMVLDKVDCSTRKASFNLQIKSLSEPFRLGDANLRFAYEPTVLASPTITKQHHFSSESPVAAADYAPLNLNGSVERQHKGLVSLNISYVGDAQGLQTVAQEWLSIATLQFDLRTNAPERNSQLKWQDESSFPVTGMTEVLVKNQQAGSEGFELRPISRGKYENLSVEPLVSVCPNLSALPEPTGEVFVPEGFSPNGDGINDKFVIANLNGLKVETFQVYSRDGILVYAAQNYQNNWDGQANQGIVVGREGLPDGTYFYRIKLSDNRTLMKSFTMAR